MRRRRDKKQADENLLGRQESLQRGRFLSGTLWQKNYISRSITHFKLIKANSKNYTLTNCTSNQG